MPREAELSERLVHVAAAALVRDDGSVLVMQRLPGTPYAGRWEFPGGKLEPGETPQAGLTRELEEELGIAPQSARPLIRIRHDYPERRVLLDCWRIDSWRGEVSAREGHALAWAAPARIAAYDMLDADRPAIAAMRLPPRYALTADAAPIALLAGLERLLDRGHTLLQLRAPSLREREYRAVAADAIGLCRARGAQLLLNADPAMALALDADGVHLNAARVAALRERPLPSTRWVAASCHDAIELARARALDCDFAVLGPVASTRSHARAAPLGWPGFAALADCAGLPVYALGGVGDADRATAWAAHGQGVAGISAWWGD